MSHKICPTSKRDLYRDTRPLTLRFEGHSLTIDMPGWYAEGDDQGLHTAEDMRVSDAALRELKRRAKEGVAA